MRTFAVAIVLATGCICSGCFKMDVNLNAPPAGDTSSKEAAGSPSSQLPALGEGGWRDVVADVAGQVFLAAEHGAVFYAFDSLAYPCQPVQLAARLQTVKLQGIEDVTIAFFDGEELIGAAKTDKAGYASMEWTPPEAGDYEFTAKIVEVEDADRKELLQITPAGLLVAARDKDTQFVVIDLDHTVVDSSFFRVLVGGARPMAGSIDAAERIAERYSVIYLTHRPDLLTRKSKVWLKRNGYPVAPLLVSELKEAFGDSGKFKTAKLSAVRESFPNVKVGIGDKASDAQAYVDNGLVAYLIPHYKDKPKDMRKAADEIERLRGHGRLHVVSDWGQIEQGLFKGKKYPPETFARGLKQRAQLLEAEEKARKKREKDDDDDDDD